MADEWKSYIDPQDDFDEINVSIHSIDEGIVAGAPTFGVSQNKINGLLNGHIVVTHTNFDKVAIYQACTKCKTMPPSCTWLARRRSPTDMEGVFTARLRAAECLRVNWLQVPGP